MSTAASGGAGDRSLVPAVTRAAAILDLVAVSTDALGVSAIARSLGLPKSSVANICGALVDAGMLRVRGGGFRLGARLARLGAAYLAGVDQVGLFGEACEQLRVGRSETAQLAQLGDRTDVVYLARRDGVVPVRLASAPGRALPASCTATGKAMLACLPADELARRLAAAGPLPRLTGRSVRSVRALRAELAVVREEGIAYDREEVIEGVVCLAAAVPVMPGDAPLAVSFTLLAPRATPATLDLLAGELRHLAAAIGTGLGAVAR